MIISPPATEGGGRMMSMSRIKVGVVGYLSPGGGSGDSDCDMVAQRGGRDAAEPWAADRVVTQQR
jgi:hypothetical protein